MSRHNIFENDWKYEEYDYSDDWDVGSPSYSYGSYDIPAPSAMTSEDIVFMDDVKNGSAFQMDVDDEGLIDRCYDELEVLIGESIYQWTREEVVKSIRKMNYSPGGVLDDLNVGRSTDFQDDLQFRFEVDQSLKSEMEQDKVISEFGSQIQGRGDSQRERVEKLGKKTTSIDGPVVIKTGKKQKAKAPEPEPVQEQTKVPYQCHPKKFKKILGELEAKLSNPDEKQVLNVVVIGHVDSGKSTIMGHLLYLAGEIDQRQMHKYTKDSEQLGKGSFRYAWVLDGQDEERERGVTIDVAVRSFETASKSITLLDAPGHRDFVPNMISGTAQADLAILVINGVRGEFEKGFRNDGQTKEHVLLAKSLGISNLIIAINKLDLEDWSETRYEEIKQELTKTLQKSGFKKNRMRWLPCSGLEGINLFQTNEDLSPWYSGKSLIDLIDETPTKPEGYDQPFRMIVSDVYKDNYSNMGTIIAGKIQSGFVGKGDRVLLIPHNEYIEVKGVKFQDNDEAYAYAGQNADVGLDVDISIISVGNVICDPEHPISMSQRFRAQVIIFSDIPNLIIAGHSVLLYMQNICEQAVIQKLLKTIDQRTGDVVRKKPKFLNDKDTASVIIRCENPICLTLFSEEKSFGRFTIRDKGRTIGAGIVNKIFF